MPSNAYDQVDFKNNEVLNMVIQNLLSDPITRYPGKLYYNTTKQVPYYGTDTEWIPMAGKPVQKRYADQAAMISDQDTQLKNYIYLDLDTDIYYEYLGTTDQLISDYNAIGGSGTAPVEITASSGLTKIGNDIQLGDNNLHWVPGTGLAYDGDWEDNFTPRTLVTQQYLTSEIIANAYIHPVFTPFSVNTSGPQIIDELITTTEGHVSSITLRNLTLADLGFTGDPDSNNYIHPSYTPLNPTLTGSSVLASIKTDSIGSVTDITTRTLTTSDINAVNINKLGVAGGVATLDSGGKLVYSQIPDSLLGGVIYQGQWNASTNVPALPDPKTVKGHYYIVQTAGTYLGISYNVGDWIISDGTVWDKVDNTDAVMSVYGRIGNVIAIATDYNSFYVRHDTNSQGLSTASQGNARANIKAQITITGGATTITTTDLTINRVLISNASGKVAVSTITTTELGYLAGVTSSIQTQLNNKLEGNEIITLTGDVTGSGATSIATTISNDAVKTTKILDSNVTYSKIQNVSANRILGQTSITGVVKELTPAEVRSIINVADGANNYIHPSKTWDDKVTLSGATVISNLTIDSLGHLIDWTTRELTPSDIGAQIAGSYVPTSRTITINGITFDLSSNRTWTIPLATSTVAGLVELFSDTVQTVTANTISAIASRTYGIQLNSSGQMVVNVPWANTVYTHPTYTAFTPNLTGANVLASLTTNTIGSVTALTTRILTPVDISAEPSFNKGSLVEGAGMILTGTLSSRLVNSGNITISHADTSSIVGPFGSTGISAITIDGFGHITSITADTFVKSNATVNFIPKMQDANTLTDSLFYESNDNMGLFTTNPIYDFHILKSGVDLEVVVEAPSSDKYASNNALADLAGISIVSFGSNYLENSGSEWAGRSGVYINNSRAGQTALNKTFNVWIGARTVLRSLDTGETAVGQFNPTAWLDVGGDLRVRNISNVASTEVLVPSTTGVINKRTLAEFKNDLGLSSSISGTGSAGQIAYWDGVNSQTGNSSFLWDNTSKSLTIIGADIRGAISIRNASVAGQPEQFFVRIKNSDVETGNSRLGNLLFFINNAEKWRITPLGELRSLGTQTIKTTTGNLSLETGGGNGNINLNPDGTGSVIINNANYNSHLKLYRNSERGVITLGVNVMLLSANEDPSNSIAIHKLGRIGIGTASPTETLHTTGSIRVETMANAVGNFVTISSTGVLQQRTAAQVLTDIGAQTAGSYVTLDTNQTITGFKTFTNGFVDMVTNMGRTYTPYVIIPDGGWAKPMGSSVFAQINSVGGPGGVGYWFVGGRRDVLGGYSGIYLPYGGASSAWIGSANTSADNPTWHKLWSSGNDGSGSGLDADLLDGQQGSYYAPASHNHVSLTGWLDTRNVSQVPNDYDGKFLVVGLKFNSTLGLDTTTHGTYSSVFGFRGWKDSTGGHAMELSVTTNGHLLYRSGSTTSWGGWNELWHSNNFDPSGYQPAGDYVTRNTEQTITGAKSFSKPIISTYATPSVDGIAGSGNGIADGFSFSGIDVDPNYPDTYATVATFKKSNSRCFQILGTTTNRFYLRALHTNISNTFLKIVTADELLNYVPASRKLTAGTGLTGGGDLTGNRSLSFDTTWGDSRYFTQSISDGKYMYLLNGANSNDVNTLTRAGIWRNWGGTNGAFGASHTTLFQAGADSYGWQLAALTSSASPRVKFRAFGANIATEASDWVELWHSGNFNPSDYQPAGSYAPASHTHSAADITSGTFGYDRLPFSSANVSDWNSAYGWGNHAGLYVPLSGASYIQSTGRSTSWGSANGVNGPQTGAFNAIMGTSSSATWLLSGTSNGVFKVGIQALDNGGAMRFYVGSSYMSFNGSTLSNVNLDGNAYTATKLQTPRTINSTMFDGSANIVTNQWGVGRNITIGNTVKLVDGSSNISWTLAQIGAQPAGNYAPASHDHPRLLNTTYLTDLNTVPTSRGELTYSSYTLSTANKPVDSNNANGVISMVSHVGPYGKQLAFADTDDLYIRRFTNNNFASWRKIWHDGNFDPATKENSFSKNTAFNKNFGTATGTVVQGDDPRINNGQTAYAWGNHATAGYQPAGDYVLWSDVATSGANKVARYESNGYLGVDNWIRLTTGTGLYSIAGHYFYHNPGNYSGWALRSISSNHAALTLENISGTTLGAVYASSSGDIGFTNPTQTNWKIRVDSSSNLHVLGDIIAFSTSDKRYKDNLRNIQNSVSLISKLNGYYFEWNDKQNTYKTGTRDIGVVAQEVEGIFPELVGTREDGSKAVKYDRLVAVLIESVKELKSEIESLKIKQ